VENFFLVVLFRCGLGAKRIYQWYYGHEPSDYFDK
jgi:hypothetical protein